MRTNVLWSVVLCAAAALMSPAMARGGTDKEDADITDADWTGADSSAFTEYYVSSTTNKPAAWTNREYRATTDLKDAHAKAEDGTKLAHTHTRYEWGDASCPSAAEANAYWDVRFAAGTKTTRESGAVMKHKTCHEWALTTSGQATGVYVYVLSNMYPFGHDVTALGNKANVAAGDILHYTGHSTYVSAVRSDGAGGNEPATLKWKWKGSGIYSYSTPNGNEFDTPMCHTGFESDIDTAKVISNQGWTWDVDFKANPGVYH